MNDNEATFTLQEAMAAQSALRVQLDLPPERFSLAQLIGMLSDEIEQLRQADASDDEIADVIEHATGQKIDTSDIAKHYASPEARQR